MDTWVGICTLHGTPWGIKRSRRGVIARCQHRHSCDVRGEGRRLLLKDRTPHAGCFNQTLECRPQTGGRVGTV